MTMTNPQKIHLDTDIGGDPDDVAALALLLCSPDVEITGITTVADSEGKRAGYARYVLGLAGREDIVVKAGADVSVGYYRYVPDIPSEHRFWPEPVPASPNPVDEALALLKQSIEQDATIIGIGQYTNLALLEAAYPGILRDANLFLMGGYIYPIREGFPTWSNEDDYNIQLDVNSAEYVLRQASPTLVPLSVTVETALRRAHLPALRESGPLGQLIALQAEAENTIARNEEKIVSVYGGPPDDILNFQHDPLTCAVALGWDGVTIEEVPLAFEIRDGLLYEAVDQRGKSTTVVTQVNSERFNQLWLNVVTRSDTIFRS